MSESNMHAAATKQLPWTGQVPPHGASFVYNVKQSPAGRIVVFTCPTCGSKLAAFVWGNPASKLPPSWWICRRGCSADVDGADA